jgi:N-acetylmuramoyl-L-alanine amidase
MYQFPLSMPLPRMILCSLFLFTASALGQSGKAPSELKKHSSGAASAKTYLIVPAQKGDDLPAFLRRYGLYDFECNITRFFEINGLKEDYRVKAGVSYKLPVEVVTYNGKSIRTTLGISDWRTAKRIESYNKFALKEGLRTDNFIETKRLWVPWHELTCPGEGETEVAAADTGPPGEDNTVVKGSRHYAIMGKKYAKTDIISHKLKGKVYYVVSGHGGPDPGAQGKRAGHTLCEDEYAYDVSLRLVRLLISHGAIAYMIVRDANDGIRDEEYLKCDQDEKVWGDLVIPRDQKERLQQRCDIINAFTKKKRKTGPRKPDHGRDTCGFEDTGYEDRCVLLFPPGK